MRSSLIALMLSISACATINPPEVSSTLRDYAPEALPAPAEPLPLTQFEVTGTTRVEGEEVAYLSEEAFGRMQEFVEAAKANTEALRYRTTAFLALEAERDHLLYAGQAAEGQADIFRQLYVAQARQCSMVQFVSIGAAGLVLVVSAL